MVNVTKELVASWTGHYGDTATCFPGYYNAVVATALSDKSVILVNEIGAGPAPYCSNLVEYTSSGVRVLLRCGNHGTRHGVLHIGDKIIMSYGIHPYTSSGVVTCVPVIYVYDLRTRRVSLYPVNDLDCTRGNIYSIVVDVVRRKLVASTGIGYFGMHVVDLSEEFTPIPYKWKHIPSYGEYFGVPYLVVKRGLISSNTVLRDGRVFRALSTTPFYGPYIQANIGFWGGVLDDITSIYGLEQESLGEILFRNEPNIKLAEVPHYVREYGKILVGLVEINDDGSWSTRTLVLDENLREVKRIEGYLTGTVVLYGRYVALLKVIDAERVDTIYKRLEPVFEDKLYLYDARDDAIVETNVEATYIPSNRTLAATQARKMSSFDTNYYATIRPNTIMTIDLYRILFDGVDYAMKTVSVSRSGRRLDIRVKVFNKVDGSPLKGVRVHFSIPETLNHKNIPGRVLDEKTSVTGSDGVAEASLELQDKIVVWNAYLVL